MVAFRRVVMVLLLALLATPSLAEEAAVLRLGLVKFGAGGWQVDTMRRHGLDQTANIRIDTVELANPAAGEVALQAGGADAILTDWLWVSRQRQAGQKIVFYPSTTALGEILVPATSPITRLADLAGKKLGIAGGPVDKSWLLLRALSKRSLGSDLADQVTPIYGAPPLLSQELSVGRLDAVLTYWPYAARLEVAGFRRLTSMSEVQAALGYMPPVPMIGYAVNESWIAAHPGALLHFLTAADQAAHLMVSDDAEWQKLRPLTGAESDSVLAALRDRFRAGVITHWRDDDRARAARLYTTLAEIGGPALTGGAAELAPGTFWTEQAP